MCKKILNVNLKWNKSDHDFAAFFLLAWFSSILTSWCKVWEFFDWLCCAVLRWRWRWESVEFVIQYPYLYFLLLWDMPLVRNDLLNFLFLCDMPLSNFHLLVHLEENVQWVKTYKDPIKIYKIFGKARALPIELAGNLTTGSQNNGKCSKQTNKNSKSIINLHAKNK